MGFSQEKLAELTNMSVQTINTIEGCRMWVSDKTITRLAKALDVEIFQLFVPLYTEKNDLNTTEAQVLIELQQRIQNSVEKLSNQLDIEFVRALKTPCEGKSGQSK